MKRARLLVVLVAFVAIASGCQLLGFLDPISPPSWIIGTWSDEFGINTYTFTQDNVVAVVDGMGSIDFAELGRNVRIDQYSSASAYEISMVEDGTTYTYRWVSTSYYTLAYSLSAGGVTIGPVELIRW